MSPGHLPPHIYLYFPPKTQLKMIVEGFFKDWHKSTGTNKIGKEMLATTTTKKGLATKFWKTESKWTVVQWLTRHEKAEIRNMRKKQKINLVYTTPPPNSKVGRSKEIMAMVKVQINVMSMKMKGEMTNVMKTELTVFD